MAVMIFPDGRIADFTFGAIDGLYYVGQGIWQIFSDPAGTILAVEEVIEDIIFNPVDTFIGVLMLPDTIYRNIMHIYRT